jgi:hypothetical protein
MSGLIVENPGLQRYMRPALKKSDKLLTIIHLHADVTKTGWIVVGDEQPASYRYRLRSPFCVFWVDCDTQSSKTEGVRGCGKNKKMGRP